EKHNETDPRARKQQRADLHDHVLDVGTTRSLSQRTLVKAADQHSLLLPRLGLSAARIRDHAGSHPCSSHTTNLSRESSPIHQRRIFVSREERARIEHGSLAKGV